MTAVLVLLTILAVAVAAFASTAVKATHGFSQSRLEDLCRKRDCLPLFVRICDNQKRGALAAESLRVLATVIAVVLLAVWLERVWTWNSLSPITATLIDLVWLSGFILILWATLIWIPVAVVDLWAEPFLVATWGLWEMAAVLFAPTLFGARLVEAFLRWSTGRTPEPTSEEAEEALEEEIRSIVSEGHREGLLEEDTREMIESVMELADVTVAEIMTPRTYMLSLSSSSSLDEAVRFILDSGHTRIPIYGRSRDDIVGVLHTKDVLAELVKPVTERRPLVELLRPPFFVPERKPVDELLTEFQRNRNHLAIVLDEFGGVSGLATIEDAIEEIVGEIADEYDDALVDGIKQLGDLTYEALATVHIDELNERLGISLPDDQDFDTIGGFVFHELGRIPEVGEELVRQDVRIKILDSSRRRIDRVVLEVLKKPAAVEWNAAPEAPLRDR